MPDSRLAGGDVDSRSSGWAIAGGIVFAAAFLNAFIFVLLYTNPIIVADDWYFLSVFLRPALEGDLEFSDFYVYRGAGDHIQPLQKVILLLQLHWFDLDYSPSAVLGVFGAGASSLILVPIIWRESEENVPDRIKFFAWALSTAALFSMNTTGSWRWPLASLNHLTSAISLVFIFFTWSELRKGRSNRIGWAVIVFTLVVGDAAVLASSAIFVVLIFCCLGSFRSSKAIRLALYFFLSLVASQVLMSSLAPVVGETAEFSTAPDQMAHLFRIFLSEGWWKWWALPLSNSVIATDRLEHLFGDKAALWQILIALSLLTLHLLFWRRFIREPTNGASFFAAALMLLFYGHVIGIILFRVSIFGTQYLEQPRYLLFYQFNLVALMVMLAAYFRPPASLKLRGAQSATFGFTLLCFFALQIEFSQASWATGIHLTAYYQKAARDIVDMEAYPGLTPKNCTTIIPLCDQSEERRIQTIGLLRRFGLNVFSARFRRIHASVIHLHE
ncbi:MAG: hypothetical protein P8M78_02540 [Myxococcota bacterium]|nr:hypothetical protein [Myxococcota bacterium]